MTTPRQKSSSINIDTKTFLLTAIAISQLLNAWLVYKTKQDIGTVHIATNSMKDALVKAARESGNAEGRKEQTEETNK